MLSRTPRSSVRGPDLDKENVTIYTPKSVGRNRPMRVGECGPMTPSRQPLAPVNGDGGGMRRVSLKPGLPRIQALRGETNTGQLDKACTPARRRDANTGQLDKACTPAVRRDTNTGQLDKTCTPARRRDTNTGQLDKACTPARHQKSARSKRHKSRSISTPSGPEESKAKTRVDLVESITSHLFNQLLLQEGLSVRSRNLTTHHQKNDKTERVQDRLDTSNECSACPEEPEPHSEDSEESVSSQDIAAFVEDIIDKAKTQITLEARIDSLEAQLQQPLAIESSASAPREEPTEEDIAAYVDAVLSVQLQIVRSESQDELDSGLAASDSVQDSEKLDSTKESLPEDKSSSPSSRSPCDGDMKTLPDTPPNRLFARPCQEDASPTSLLLDDISMAGTPWGLSPGYMLLPPRRDHREHLSSEGSYEDEFLRFVHSQYQSGDERREATSVATPLKMIDSSTTTSSVLLNDLGTSTSPSKLVHSETFMTPHKFADMACGASTEMSSTEECGTQMEQVILQDAQIGSPVQMASVGVEMTPVKPCNAETNTSPIRLKDESTEVTIEVRDSSTDAPHVELCDAMVGTPIKQTSAGVGTSPISFQDHGSFMTPIKMQSTGEGTSPTRVCQRGTEMPPVDLMESGVGTSPPPAMKESGVGTSPPPAMKESGVGTSPTVCVNKEVGTPIQTSSLGCGTTPHQYSDSTTAMTPVMFSSAETLTSPLVVPSLRFSSSPSSLDSSKLVSHVETAAISNQLLRAELSLLRSQKEQVESGLLEARRQIQENQEKEKASSGLQAELSLLRTQKEQVEAGLQDARRQVQEKEQVVKMKEEKMGALERTARASAEKEVDDLMSQVGEQMMQIGQLEATIREKSELISSLEAKNQKLKRDYDQQIADLQDDLCRAYRQHQQQITSLQEEYRQDDYKGHYTRSHARVVELETRMEAFTQLQEAIGRAVNVQNDFAVAQKTFSDVEAVFQMTVKQQQQLASQIEELAKERLEVEAEKAVLMQMREEREKAKEREVAHFLEVQNLEAAMLAETEHHACKQAEFEQSKKEREVAHFLEVQNLEAAMLAETEQHACKQAEFEQSKRSLQETINQLQKQCQGLSSGKVAVEVDLKGTRTKLFSVEAELADTRKDRDEQVTRASGLEKELDSCREAASHLQVLEAKFKALERQFVENKQFLEEERLALEESSKEVETELSITSLELARTRAAQEEGDLARRHLQETAMSLSDQLESVQSELDHTKAQAHWMLLSQGSELTNASAALETLRQQVATALAGMQDTYSEEDGQQQDADEPSSNQSASLVVSVLRAVEHIETPGKETSSVEPQIGMNQEQLSPGEGEEAGERRLTITKSEASAFEVVKSASSQGCHGDETTPSNESLTDQIKGLKGMFSRMYGMTVKREECMTEDIQRLQQELSDKERILKRVVESSQRDVGLLEEQLQGALTHRHQLSHDLAEAQARSHDQRQALDYAQQRMEDMASNLARFSDQRTTIQDLERRVSELASSLELVTREKEEALSQVTALASHPAPGPGVTRQDGEAMGRALRENLLLKKELDKVRMTLMKQQEDHELFYTKAGKQMKVLESNWKKAEAEIQRLDQVFDHCRKVMGKVPKSVCQVDSNLRLLYQMFSAD